MVEDTNQTIALEDLTGAEYRAAREAGATTTIDKSQLEDVTPPEITGDETQKEYKEKREEQQGKKQGAGFQKRIHKLTKEKAELQERLARYESGEANQARDISPENSAEEQQLEQKLKVLRAKYSDWDQVNSRAKNENLRISDDAVEVMRSLGHADDVRYEVIKNDALRNHINSLPPAQQVEIIRGLNQEVHLAERGIPQLAEKMKTSFSGEEMREILKAMNENKLSEELGEDLAPELLDLPNGPQVLRYLITNPEAAKRLAELPSRRAAVLELGRISSKLDGRYGLRIESRAPTPIKPVSGGSTKNTVPLDKVESQAEYKRRRLAGEK